MIKKARAVDPGARDSGVQRYALPLRKAPSQSGSGKSGII